MSDIDEVEAGTPLYTAPEMIQNLKYSYPVDCWSLGVLLHELLCLSMPFGGGTTGKLVNSILNDKPPKVSEVNYSEGTDSTCCFVRTNFIGPPHNLNLTELK